MSKKKKIPNAEMVILDYDEFSDSAFEQFEAALKFLGIYAYNLDTGSDTYMIALSREELNAGQLAELSKEFGVEEE